MQFNDYFVFKKISILSGFGAINIIQCKALSFVNWFSF